MKTNVLCLLVFLELHAYAQEVTSLTLHFESDDATMSAASGNSLDSVIRKLRPTARTCRAEIDGHTDNEGSLDYNRSLSARRAEGVAEFLRQNGFSADAVSTRAHAFLIPAADNRSEPGKALNRRVTVTFLVGAFAAVAGKAPSPSTYTVAASSSLQVIHPSGTSLQVPGDAFVTKDDKPVTGTVNIEYTEYRNVLDFLSSGIPMSFHNDRGEFVQFNSAGMFRIEARAGDEPLKLKEGVTITVDFAKTQNVDDMGIFYYDEKSGRWTTSQQAPDTTAQNPSLTGPVPQPFAASSFVASSFSRWRNCGQEACRCMRAAVKTGLRLSGKPFIVDVKKPEIAYNKHFRGFVPAYRIIKLSESKKSVRFAIMPDRKAYPVPPPAVYIWEYSKKNNVPFRDEWEERLWTRLKIEQVNKDNCFITLWRNAERLSLGVTLVTTNTQKSKKRIVRIMKNVQAPRAGAGEWELRSPYDYIWDTDYSRGRYHDSLYCFYRSSRAWMTDSAEKTLSFGAWLDYFNTHKPEMAIRYKRLSEDPALIAQGCERLSQQERASYVRDSLNSIRWALASSQYTTINSLNQRLAIPRLGVWNCDQVYRLKQPLYVRSWYRTEGGDTLKPLAISVVDPKVNGILMYNEYDDLNPYNFPLSSKSDNVLIAFDDAKNIFLCDPPTLKTAIRSGAPIGLRKVDMEELALEVRRWAGN